MRERRDGAAFDQLRDERFLCVAARERHRPAHHQRAEKRLDDEPAPQAFEHDGDIETLAAEAAVGLAEQRADDAQFGEAAPHLAAESIGGAREPVARLEAVLLADEAIQRIRQHAAVFGVLEVHGDPLTVPGSSWR